MFGLQFLKGFAPVKRPLDAEVSQEPAGKIRQVECESVPLQASQQAVVQFVRPSAVQSRSRFGSDRTPGTNRAAEGKVSEAGMRFAALRARVQAKEAANKATQPP